MGFIAMKALSGGLLLLIQEQHMRIWHNITMFCQFGVQRETEMDRFLSYEESACYTKNRHLSKREKQLSGDFCRGCGYCMPCPAGIEINNCARMSLMIAGH